jgi:D-glycero-alpha-D-manno-heptose-7-phosphate kinase
MKEVKRVKAPVRIDFAGGTTDVEPFPTEYGGAVLNIGINHYVIGNLESSEKSVSLSYSENIPTSSGLGTSSVMNLVWLSLISQNRFKTDEDKMKLAEQVYKIEQDIGLVGGKQDEYAGAMGGIHLMEFKKNNKVKIHKVKLKPSIIKELESHLILVYTGKPHFSGDTNGSAIENLKKGKTTQNLLRIKKIAFEMKKALERGKLDRFAELLNEETHERSKLSDVAVPPKIWELIEKGKENGAKAAKVCGSGGGGCLLFYGDKKKIKKTFGDMCIDFKIDFGGLRWI